ncbi:cysteine hydrolase family protein [Frankia sp. AiPa1]|uniref:cysteine hydrolase family protein n=1 Tax=Frankia sp. AiPa1 TaxID=573492 RepID=UPI00202AEFD3|nr:isochorismatase family cysteine hydrolase [Frankia sp. AiPa1]MCL9759475.1 cysteine hydrolase [Frankia sp. AiPa1]
MAELSALDQPALLVIDVQNDFSLRSSPHAVPGTDELVPTIGRVVSGFRAAGLPLIHVVRLYLADGSNADLCRRPLLTSGVPLVRPGTEGSQVRTELQPSPPFTLDHESLLAGSLQPVGPNEWVMYKPRWGAFFATELEAHLRTLGVETVTTVGANFPNCPRTTIYEASERDFKLVIVADALSRAYPQGLDECAGIGARILVTDELLTLLDSRRSGAANQ